MYPQQVPPQQVPPQQVPPQQVSVRPPTTVVTYSIIAICVAVWVGEMRSTAFFDEVALSPELGRTEPWRFLTSAFAHSTNITHILFNMFALWTLRSLEVFLGKARFVALYLLSALAGGVAYVAMANPHSMDWYTGLVGASGAIFGVFGALMVIYRHLGQPVRNLALLLGLNAFIGFTVPGIAWQAHLGGFIAGAAAGAIVIQERKSKSHGGPDRTWLWLGVLTAIVVAAAVVKYATV